jgi:hypothetical protein
MTVVLAIDPGPTESAYVRFDTETRRLLDFGKVSNVALLIDTRLAYRDSDRLVVEMIASYGMPVGREVFETCVYIGRLLEAWSVSATSSLMYRKDVKLHLCGQVRAKDANVRQALLDRFGPGKAKSIGTKSIPGPLYGVSGDVWSALAVAVTYADALTATNARAA